MTRLIPAIAIILCASAGPTLAQTRQATAMMTVERALACGR
jgi:hypothetical protein